MKFINQFALPVLFWVSVSAFGGDKIQNGGDGCVAEFKEMGLKIIKRVSVSPSLLSALGTERLRLLENKVRMTQKSSSVIDDQSVVVGIVENRPIDPQTGLGVDAVNDGNRQILVWREWCTRSAPSQRTARDWMTVFHEYLGLIGAEQSQDYSISGKWLERDNGESTQLATNNFVKNALTEVQAVILLLQQRSVPGLDDDDQDILIFRMGMIVEWISREVDVRSKANDELLRNPEKIRQDLSNIPNILNLSFGMTKLTRVLEVIKKYKPNHVPTTQVNKMLVFLESGVAPALKNDLELYPEGYAAVQDENKSPDKIFTQHEWRNIVAWDSDLCTTTNDFIFSKIENDALRQCYGEYKICLPHRSIVGLTCYSDSICVCKMEVDMYGYKKK